MSRVKYGYVISRLNQAFTLIELLVVCAIIMVLSSLLLAIVGSAEASKDIRNTELLIQTVASAIGRFEGETGAYPLSKGGPSDLDGNGWQPDQLDGQWDKQQLWWRLGHQLTGAERQQMRESAKAAKKEADPFSFIKEDFGDLNPTELREKKQEILDNEELVSNEEAESYKGTYTQNIGDDAWTFSDLGYPDASENNLSVRGHTKRILLEQRGVIARDQKLRMQYTYSCLDTEDLVIEDCIRGGTILDAWGVPLIYVSTSSPEIKQVKAREWNNAGLKFIGRDKGGRQEMTDRDGDGLVTRDDWSIEPDSDLLVDMNTDGVINKEDWGHIVYNAWPGNKQGFYLASSGPDESFNCLIFDTVNDDTISAKQKR
ncbi:MAG: type II secretion system protein [Planctomycetes bacterium]|nr:type II secretion system protein [Planctomycetota bacterium]